MFALDVLAGSPIRLTATAKAGAPAIHRWQIRLLPAAADQMLSADPSLSYGSQIGGDDREQHIEIPARRTDCRLEVGAFRHDGTAWREEPASGRPSTDTPDLLEIGFGAATTSGQHDVLLSFRFRSAGRTRQSA